LVLPVALSGCHRPDPFVSLDPSLQMVDCSLARSGLLHLHLSPGRGLASVLSAYQPGGHDEHAAALRRARESKGRWLREPDGGYRIDIFLRAESFGARADERLILKVDPAGVTRLEALSPDATFRLLDSGSCQPTTPVER
jgi:hypothetical protein